MSEPAPETSPAQSSSSGNVFTRKIGPMPLWGWMGIGLALALGYYFWKQNSSKSSSTTSSTSSTTGTDVSGQIPQYVNQTYVNGTPPSSSSPTSGNPAIQPLVTHISVPVSTQTPTSASVAPVSTTTTAPATPTTSVPGGTVTTIPHYLDRSWTTPNATMTIADVGKALNVTDPGLNLKPNNTVAKNFMNTTFAKNPNAKIPKGAQFTYVYGS